MGKQWKQQQTTVSAEEASTSGNEEQEEIIPEPASQDKVPPSVEYRDGRKVESEDE